MLIPPQYVLDALRNEEDEPANYAKSEVILRRLLKEHPEDEHSILHFLMVTVSLLEKDDECIEMCHRLLKLDKRPRDISDHLFCIADCYEHKKDMAKAIEYYNKVIEIGFDPDESILKIADIYIDKKEWDNALRTYDRLLALEDEYAKEEELNCKGKLYIKKRELDTALDYFMQGVKLFPESPAFYESIGSVYYERKEWDTALEWFDKMYQAEPDLGIAFYNMGLCWQAKEDYQRAMHYYTEALNIELHYPEAFNNLAKLCVEHKCDILKTIELLEESIEVVTNEKLLPPMYFNIMRVYERIDNRDKADYYKMKWMNAFGFDSAN